MLDVCPFEKQSQNSQPIGMRPYLLAHSKQIFIYFSKHFDMLCVLSFHGCNLLHWRDTDGRIRRRH